MGAFSSLPELNAAQILKSFLAFSFSRSFKFYKMDGMRHYLHLFVFYFLFFLSFSFAVLLNFVVLVPWGGW